MNGNWLAVTIAAIMVLSSEGAGDEPVDRVVRSLLTAHNRERRLEELDPLTLSPQLCAAARIHARDMASHQMISHTGTDGSAPRDRIKRAGYIAARTGENCAEGQWTVGEVMKGWMKSPGHRANILSKYTEMGAGWATDDEGTIYWCVDFGTPRLSAPKTPVKPHEIAAAVVTQINRDRQFGRMVLLDSDPKLNRAAMALSKAMADKNSLEIDGSPEKFIDKSALEGRDIHFKSIAGAMTPVVAASKLREDDVERSHALRQIGVGYAVAKNRTPYWCVIYARPMDTESSEGPE